MLNENLLSNRAGNFTASENHRLMAGWDNSVPSRDYPEFENLYKIMSNYKTKPTVGQVKPEYPGVTGALINKTWDVIKSEIPPAGLVSYAQEKAIEELFNVDPSLNFSTVHTRNGEERELECMDRLARATGLNFVNTGDDQEHIHVNGIGCTPDGVVLDDIDLIETGAEVKCKSPSVHAANLLINDGKDMKEKAFDHYVQVQTAMLVTGAGQWYFANFNPYAKDEAHKFRHITVSRDDDFIEILERRINWAKKIKSEYLQKLKASDTTEQ